MKLQVKDSGAWRNVLAFAPGCRADVELAAATLLAAIKCPKTTMRVCDGDQVLTRLPVVDVAGAAGGGLVDDPRFRQMMHEYLMGDITLEQVAGRLEEWRGGQSPTLEKR